MEAVDDNFVNLVKERSMEKNKEKRAKLNIQIKKLSAKLRKEYYSKKAKLKNEASVCSVVEDESRKARDYIVYKTYSRTTKAP